MTAHIINLAERRQQRDKARHIIVVERLVAFDAGIAVYSRIGETMKLYRASSHDRRAAPRGCDDHSWFTGPAGNYR